MDWKRLLFAWDGRIGRRAYWSVLLPIALALIVATFLDSVLFGLDQEQPLSGVVSLIAFYPQLVVSAKRLHDLGYSGWLQIAPPAAMVLAGVLMATLGAAGPPFAMLAQIGVLAAVVFGIGFWLWIGFARGADAPNGFGFPESGARDVAPPPSPDEVGFEPGD